MIDDNVMAIRRRSERLFSKRLGMSGEMWVRSYDIVMTMRSSSKDCWLGC